MELGRQVDQGFNAIGVELNRIDQTLERMSRKIDAIYDKIDASIKADFDNGCDAFDLYEKTHDSGYLLIARGHFGNFINAFQRTSNSSDEQELLKLARLSRLAVLNSLFMETKNSGYASKAVEHFIEMSSSSEPPESIISAYLCIVETDLEGRASRKLLEIFKPEIINYLQSGALDDALQKAGTVALLTGLSDAEQFKKAVSENVETGRDETGLLGLSNQDYQLLVQYINQKKLNSLKPTWACIRYIINGNATPNDYIQVIGKYQSAVLNEFAIRQLIKNEYYVDALKILGEYPVKDDAFRTKAYLVIYSKTGSPKLAPLMELVKRDQTYTTDVKKFANKLRMLKNQHTMKENNDG